MSEELTEFEREVYRFIKKHGALMTTSMPDRMMGAIPNLVNKGLIEVVKRYTSPWRSRKKKFVRVNEEES